MRSWLVSVAAAVILEACGGGGSKDNSVVTQDVTMTFFRSFGVGTYVIRSQAELSSAWAAAPFEIYPVGLVQSEPAMPAYDFGKNSVLGVSLGIGKWCFKPNITTVESAGDGVVVHYSVSTASTLACLKDGPLISFVLVPSFTGSATFIRDGG